MASLTVAQNPPTALLADWHGEPSVLLGVLALSAAYVFALWRRRPADAVPVPRWRLASFVGSQVAILAALSSPLHELSDHYLFSAHMVQHLLLIMVMPVLLLLSVPPWLLSPVLRMRRIRAVLRVLTLPPVGFFLFNGVFAGSHSPAFYDLALEEHAFHTLEHLVFMATSVLAWWPVLSPARELPPIPPPTQILYLFIHTFPMLMVGAIITDADVVLYPVYAVAPRVWGISPLNDQQAGGLIMWIGGSLFYLLVLTTVFFRWAGQEETKEPWAQGPTSGGDRPEAQTSTAFSLGSGNRRR